jgi:hypothetical protein
MEFPRFQQLVQRYEVRAARRPVLYRWEVGLFATFGYLYLLAVTLLLVAWVIVALAAGFELGNWIFVLYAVPATVALAAIARSLRVIFHRPVGISVSLEESPDLAHLIEQIRNACHGPTVDRVLVTTDFNASVTQHPRLGVLGWYENTLTIGIQLLVAFPTSEFISILAHEFGHLAGDHGRMGAWIHRQRVMYARIGDAMAKQEGRLSRWIFAPLERWFFPYFNARAFALSRQQEYDADQFAARFVGAETSARALARHHVVERWRGEKQGPALAQLNQQGALLPDAVYDTYLAEIRDAVTWEDSERWLLEALRVPTDFADSHPSFHDRLAALLPGHAPTPPTVTWDFSEAPAISLFGRRGPALQKEASDAWRAVAGPEWTKQAAWSATARERLLVLAQKDAEGTSTPEERWERVTVTEQLEGISAAASLARQLAERDPKLYGARYLAARDLLRTDPDAALAELETIATASFDSFLSVAELSFNYLWAQGRREDAERWRRRYIEREQVMNAASQERSTYLPKMAVQAHDLPAEEVERIRSVLTDHPGVRRAYLVRRVVKHLPDQPSYVVGIVPRIAWYRPIRVPFLRELTAGIARSTTWPPDTHIIPLEMELKGLRKKFRKIPGALIAGKE